MTNTDEKRNGETVDLAASNIEATPVTADNLLLNDLGVKENFLNPAELRQAYRGDVPSSAPEAGEPEARDAGTTKPVFVPRETFEEWCARREREKKPRKQAVSGSAEKKADELLLAAARDLIKPCPETGRHYWIYGAACALITAGYSDEEAEPIIRELLTTRTEQEGEIAGALASARADFGMETRSARPKWSERDATAISEVAKNGIALPDLIARSPYPVAFDRLHHTNFYVKSMFPPDAWFCCGKTKRLFATRKLAAWLQSESPYLYNTAFIVPSPMTAQKGLTKKGLLSHKSNSNAGPRRFIVTEFDQGTLNEHAAIIWHLSASLPLTCVAFSGSKSLHGWFFCEGVPDSEIKAFFDKAVAVGADTATWSPSQFVRTPDGSRTPYGSKHAERPRKEQCRP